MTDDSIEVDPEGLIVASADGNQPTTIPKMVEFHTQAWYDQNLLDNFNGDHFRTKTWITNLISLANFRLSEESLEMKVKILLDNNGEINYAKGYRLKADGKSLKTIKGRPHY